VEGLSLSPPPLIPNGHSASVSGQRAPPSTGLSDITAVFSLHHDLIINKPSGESIP
jgi:hypothetical protein